MLPTFSYDRWPADHIRIEYSDKGLGIFPLPESQLQLQRGENIKPLQRYQGLKESLRGQDEEPFLIHVGEPAKSGHKDSGLPSSKVVWQFRW